MVKGRGIYLLSILVLIVVLFCLSSLINDLVFRPSDDRSRLLAEDAILVAHNSVREAMLTLLRSHEDERRTAFKRGAIHALELERLQASLDHIYRDSPSRNTASLRELPGPPLVEPHPTMDIHHVDLCGIMAGKRITMIGGEHIYRLHRYLLQHRERAEKKPFPCPYHEFCTHHHICLPDNQVRGDVPPPRYVKPPTSQELIETESTVVNYIVSDTLISSTNESFWGYTLPFVDPTTGVRLRETYWLAAARKANVVILGRGPMSAPGPTYIGNWSFLRDVPDYVDKSRVIVATGFRDHDDEPSYSMAPRSLEILNAAVHMTISYFLPDLLQLLQSIQEEVRPSRQKRLIWPSTWYRLPGRGVARTALLPSEIRKVVRQAFLRDRPRRSSAEHVLALQLAALIDADVTNTAQLEDPWTLLFNAQVYLQNMVLRELLHRHGIIFLPLDVPWAWGDQDHRHSPEYSDGTVNVELERTTTIGETFLTEMDYVLRYLG